EVKEVAVEVVKENLKETLQVEGQVLKVKAESLLHQAQEELKRNFLAE
ncbi:MAG: hypothetical protein RL062_1200, partial [Bacteroidota bacterium]